MCAHRQVSLLLQSSENCVCTFTIYIQLRSQSQRNLHKEHSRSSPDLITSRLKGRTKRERRKVSARRARTDWTLSTRRCTRVHAVYVLCMSFRWNALCEVRYTPPCDARICINRIREREHAPHYMPLQHHIYVSRHYREFATVKLVHRGCTTRPGNGLSLYIPHFNSNSR